MPLSLIPPKGAISVEMMPLSTPTMLLFERLGDPPDAADAALLYAAERRDLGRDDAHVDAAAIDDSPILPPQRCLTCGKIRASKGTDYSARHIARRPISAVS